MHACSCRDESLHACMISVSTAVPTTTQLPSLKASTLPPLSGEAQPPPPPLLQDPRAQRERMSEGGSPRMSVSGFSSLLSISSASTTDRPQMYHHGHEELDLMPSLSLSVGGNGDGDGSMSNNINDDDDDKTIRMMKNRESALRSRARKRAYVQELEKEVRRLVDQNLNLKRQCKQLKSDMAALIQQTKSPHRRTSSTQF